MPHVIVTGAAGFIGQALVRRLLREGLGGRPVEALTAVDLHFGGPDADPDPPGYDGWREYLGAERPRTVTTTSPMSFRPPSRPGTRMRYCSPLRSM